MNLRLLAATLVLSLAGCGAGAPPEQTQLPEGAIVLDALAKNVEPRFIGQTHNLDLYVVADERLFVAEDTKGPFVEVNWKASVPAGAKLEAFAVGLERAWLLAVADGTGHLMRLDGKRAEVEHTLANIEGPFVFDARTLLTRTTFHQRGKGYSDSWHTGPLAEGLTVSGIADNNIELAGFALDAEGKLVAVRGGYIDGFPWDQHPKEGGDGLKVQCIGTSPGGDWVALLGADPKKGPTHIYEGPMDFGTLTPTSQFQLSGPCLGGPTRLGQETLVFRKRLFSRHSENFGGASLDDFTITAVATSTTPNEDRWAAGLLTDGTPAAFPVPLI